ncbi:hypothetical protein BAE44_0017447, partial [Dichanthelium oligosanthes]
LTRASASSVPATGQQRGAAVRAGTAGGVPWQLQRRHDESAAAAGGGAPDAEPRGQDLLGRMVS